MPNWCQNILEIRGSEEELERFMNKSEDRKFTLEQYYPYGTEDGEWNYDWCFNNWGTKWDVNGDTPFLMISSESETSPPQSNTEMSSHNEGISISFLTAWSPPFEGILHISKDYPELYFSLIYCETGGGFAGSYYMMDGELILHQACSVDESINRYDFSHSF